MSFEKVTPIAEREIKFIVAVFARLLPAAKIRVIYDFSKSLDPTVEVTNGDYPVANLDLRLLLERYANHGNISGDEYTRIELKGLGTIPNAPPVSTGSGVPANDPFAPPVGLPTPDRLKGK